MKFCNIFLILFFLIFSEKLAAQSTMPVTAVSSSDGKKITITWTPPKVSGATFSMFSILVSGAGSTTTYSSSGTSIDVNSQSSTSYNISVTGGYLLLGSYFRLAGSAYVVTNIDLGGGGGGGGNTNCLLNNTSFNFNATQTGSYIKQDNQVIVIWTPPIPALNSYKFRYRINGTLTWSYTSAINVSLAGFVFGGLQMGTEYEFQVALVCSATSTSAYSNSYYGWTYF